MPVYNLVEYSDNYSKISESLYQFCRDDASFKFKSTFLGNTNNAGIINAERAVSLKYLSNFWRTL